MHPPPPKKKYRKIPLVSPGIIFVQKTFFWTYFRGSLFSEGLIIGGNFAFQNGLDLTMKTASTSSPWACIREGLLSEGYLRLRFGGGGLIFGRDFFWGGCLSSEFCGICSIKYLFGRLKSHQKFGSHKNFSLKIKTFP